MIVQDIHSSYDVACKETGLIVTWSSTLSCQKLSLAWVHLPQLKSVGALGWFYSSLTALTSLSHLDI